MNDDEDTRAKKPCLPNASYDSTEARTNDYDLDGYVLVDAKIAERERRGWRNRVHVVVHFRLGEELRKPSDRHGGERKYVRGDS